MSKNSIKLAIKLTEEQVGSFPIEIERIWFDKEDKYYRVKNIPQFIDNLSFDDIVSIKSYDESLYTIDKVITPSSNSTIWILAKGQNNLSDFLNCLTSLGCGVEGGAFNGYYSVNIFKDVDIDDVYELIDQAENNGQLVADYPSIRH